MVFLKNPREAPKGFHVPLVCLEYTQEATGEDKMSPGDSDHRALRAFSPFLGPDGSFEFPYQVTLTLRAQWRGNKDVGEAPTLIFILTDWSPHKVSVSNTAPVFLGTVS